MAIVFPKLFLAAALVIALISCGAPDDSLRKLDAELQQTDQAPGLLIRRTGPAIRVVGSSTVAPFAETVAEQFGVASRFRTPIVETTGTGGGFRAFCSSRSANHPSIVNASRPIKPSERELCASNGIDDILEFAIGFDGIAIVNAWDGPAFELSKVDIFRALASELPDGEGNWIPNPHRLWSEVVAELPDERIRVSGPPSTSGTRDAFLELVMEPGAVQIPQLARLKDENSEEFERRAHTLRDDGAWLDAGENDAAIIQSLVKNETALGVLGFSFLSQNADRVRAASIDGTVPTVETIIQGEYEISRLLYFYLREDDVDNITGLAEFVRSFLSEDAIGPTGFLVERGLIPLPDEQRSSMQTVALQQLVQTNLSDR
ncbi:MAG: substrate-binding domain-containing protein [Pseudomonadota bacterium]